LGISAALTAAAQHHSDDQALRHTMTHNGGDGSTPAKRISAAGYKWRTVGENVAFGYPDEDTCMRQWMESPGHRANILGKKFTHFGSAVGYVNGKTPYYTQDFGGDGGKYGFDICPKGTYGGSGYPEAGGKKYTFKLRKGSNRRNGGLRKVVKSSAGGPRKRITKVIRKMVKKFKNVTQGRNQYRSGKGENH